MIEFSYTAGPELARAAFLRRYLWPVAVFLLAIGSFFVFSCWTIMTEGGGVGFVDGLVAGIAVAVANQVIQFYRQTVSQGSPPHQITVRLEETFATFTSPGVSTNISWSAVLGVKERGGFLILTIAYRPNPVFIPIASIPSGGVDFVRLHVDRGTPRMTSA